MNKRRLTSQNFREKKVNSAKKKLWKLAKDFIKIMNTEKTRGTNKSYVSRLKKTRICHLDQKS